MTPYWIDKIFSITSEEGFNEASLEAFRFQYKNIPVYQQYCKLRNANPLNIEHYTAIPFLPISFFKSHAVKPPQLEHAEIFTSSGTTGSIPSCHYVHDLSIYTASFSKAFELFYGNITDYCVLALLPSYLERKGSSLILMAEWMIKESKNSNSGFYLNNLNELVNVLQQNEAAGQKTILLGVTYALLDLAEQNPLSLKNTIVMETGGMKGRRKEMIKEEVHAVLKTGLGIGEVHSEYGMTELLSQAYSKGKGLFETPLWMKVLVRDSYDPYTYLSEAKSGGINVIDLANLYSCSFIETQDLGKIHNNGQFEVLGRFDQSDIRGCNLMVGA
jgi:phenylacetate-coenzyme A ligase PaaK-like adenylate-forming protein